MQAYLKAVMAVLGAVLTSLSVYYGHTQWYPIVVTGITALSVYLVPNTPAQPPAIQPVNPTPAPAMEPEPPATDGWENIR